HAEHYHIPKCSSDGNRSLATVTNSFNPPGNLVRSASNPLSCLPGDVCCHPSSRITNPTGTCSFCNDCSAANKSSLFTFSRKLANRTANPMLRLMCCMHTYQT